MGKSVISAIDVAARALDPALTLRAVDYLRVSTEDQTKGYGIAYTGKRTASHIQKKGWTHVDTFKDEGESGTLPWQEREGATKIMDLAVRTPRPFDVVVVYETRAIGRKNRVFWEWVWKLQDLGVFVAVVDEDIDNTTEDGEARMREKANEAFKELARIRKRTQGGIQEKAELGEYAGGQPHYGYRIKNQGKKGEQELVIDECDGGDVCTRTDPCEIVHEAYVLREGRKYLIKYRGDWTKSVISLNARGLVNRSGKPWSAKNFRDRLMDEDLLNARRTYRHPKRANLGPDGKPVWGPTVVIELPQIFTEEEVAELRRVVRLPKSSRGTGRVYPLSGRLQSLCGKFYTGGGAGAEDSPRYTCRGSQMPYPGAPTCSCVTLHAESVEAWAWQQVCDLLGNSEKLHALADEWVGVAKDQSVDYVARLAVLDQQIAEQDDTLDIMMAVAAKKAARAGLKGAEAEASVDKAIKREVEALESLKKERVEIEIWQAESSQADERAKDLQELVQRANARLENFGEERQAEFMELLNIKMELAGPPPCLKGLECSIGQWFRENDRLVPTLCDHSWELVMASENFPNGGTVPRQKGGLAPRTVLEAFLKKARTGAAWPELNAECGSTGLIGHWRRWVASGRWERVMEALKGAEGLPAAPRYPLPPLRMTGEVRPGVILAASVLGSHVQESDPSAPACCSSGRPVRGAGR
ncbi:recombinase family protein [Streptomyces celluloflavus]|uniref:Recombinase family protein n=1 Tax=Streptomyces celluloflavus TaxID=58344 RepID=A0ABW7RJX6_9ACTN|nr:recombinase family protein [Streptomyces celluloflavus]